AHVLEEDLTELALAGDLAETPDHHAGCVELHQDERDAAVAILRVGTREDEDPIGPRTERRPHLLAVQDEVVAVEHGGGPERGEVASRSRLAEALTPDLVAREHGRDEAAALLLGAVMDERRPEQPDPQDVQDRRRVGTRALGLEDRFLDLGRTATTPLRRPVHTEIAGAVELVLPRASQLDQAVLGGGRIAQRLAPGAFEVGGEPRA